MFTKYSEFGVGIGGAAIANPNFYYKPVVKPGFLLTFLSALVTMDVVASCSWTGFIYQEML